MLIHQPLILVHIKHKFNIYFNSGIEDNSDLANQVNHGTYFRQDMTLYSDDAYLWRANYQDKVEIIPGLTFNYSNPSDGSIDISSK